MVPLAPGALPRLERVNDTESECSEGTEEPVKREETDDTQPELRSTGFQGGYGSSSLKECIDLLNAKNAKPRDTPAPLDSGVDHDSVSPPQVMSPNMEGPLTKAEP